MQGFQPISWICLALLIAQTSSAPPRNEVVEKAPTDLNVDPNKGPKPEQLQDIQPANKEPIYDTKAEANTGPELAVDGQTQSVEKGVEITGKGKADQILLQNGNVPDSNLAETEPVPSETVQGSVEKEPILQETGESISGSIAMDGKGTPLEGVPSQKKESAYICIEIASPDAFKAGLIHGAEKSTSRSNYDNLRKIGSKVDNVFRKLFKSFVHSKVGPGSVDKLATTVSVDTSVENMHQIEKGNAAKDPFSQKTDMKEIPVKPNGVDLALDTIQNRKLPTKQNVKVYTGDEARRRSKKIFENLQNVGDKIGQVFNEFFPGLVNVKISTGPKSDVKPELKKNNFLRKDKLNNVYIPTDNKNGKTGDVSKTINDKPIRAFDKVEKGIDSFLGGIKPFVNPFLNRFHKKADQNKQMNSDSFFDANFHKEMERMAQKISRMVENIFSKSFMKDRFFSGPSSLDSNIGIPPKTDKPLKDKIKTTGDKIPVESAKERGLPPNVDTSMQSDPLAWGPDFSGGSLADPRFEPHFDTRGLQRRFQGIYSDLMRTMIGPVLQSISKSFSDSFSHTGKDIGKSQPQGDKLTDPVGSTVV